MVAPSHMLCHDGHPVYEALRAAAARGACIIQHESYTFVLKPYKRWNTDFITNIKDNILVVYEKMFCRRLIQCYDLIFLYRVLRFSRLFYIFLYQNCV